MGHPLLFLVVTWQRYRELSACFQAPLPLQKLGLDLTISLTLCMPRELLYIGMLEKAWRKENSLKPVKIWLLWRKITRRSVWTLLMVKERMRETNTRPNHNDSTACITRFI